MAKILIIPFVLAIAVGVAFALEQKITVYELPNQQGDSHTFTGKYPDLTNMTFFLSTVKSYCVTGWFIFYDTEDFSYNNLYLNSEMGIDLCENDDTMSYVSFKSGRILGPTDFYAPALALYEGTDVAVGGREIIVTAAASNNFGFLPGSVVSFGNSSWTFFNESNFEGSSRCFGGESDTFGVTHEWSTSRDNPVQSVIKGCDPADVEYYRNLYA